MVARTLPGLGLSGFWNYREDGWNTGMDTNLRKLSVLTQLSARDIRNAPPSGPANGDIYIVGSAATGVWGPYDNHIAARDNGAWAYIPPETGMISYVEDEDAYYRYDNGWEEFSGGGRNHHAFQAFVSAAEQGRRYGSMANGTWGTVEFGSTAVNSSNAYRSALNAFVAPEAGIYHFSASVGVTAPVNNDLNIWLSMGIAVSSSSASPPLTGIGELQQTGGDVVVNHAQCVRSLNAGQQVRVQAQMNNRGGVNALYSQFSGYRIGDA